MPRSKMPILKAAAALLAATLLICALAGADVNLVIVVGGAVALAVAGGWLAWGQMSASKLKGVALLCTVWIVAPVVAYFGFGLPAGALSGEELHWQWSMGHVLDRLFICYRYLGPLTCGSAIIACLLARRVHDAPPV
jgi:hypothetical protein